MSNSHYIICTILHWFKNTYTLATDNHSMVTGASVIVAFSLQLTEVLSTEQLFGTTTIVLLVVFSTIAGNTIYGILKSKKMEKFYAQKAFQFEYQSRKYRYYKKKSEDHEFSMKKLNFVFFKTVFFLAYLASVNALMNAEDMEPGSWELKALDLTTEALIRVPVIIFWYSEFKSIGENSADYYNKKAYIFKIAEFIFEPRISKFFGSTTPTDGTNQPKS